MDRSYCNMDLTSSKKSSNCGLFEDCCPVDKAILPSPSIPAQGCMKRKELSCPWCVSLFKSAGRNKPKRLFCGGVLIGSKIVLTTATCYMDSQKDDIWAKLPASGTPDRLYYVQFRKANNAYNAETHENDIAIFILENEIKRPNKNSHGACLDVEMSMEEEQCASFGFKQGTNEIHTTDLIVSQRYCHAGKVPPTSFCGNPMMDAACIVEKGAPVVCKSRNSNHWVVAGIAIRGCLWVPEIGSLASSSAWLREELSHLGVNETHYNSP